MNPASSSWLEHVTANNDNVQMFMGITVVVIVTAIVVTGRTIRAASRERTKREIAAYIAEGSMTPEQGDRLIKSGPREV